MLEYVYRGRSILVRMTGSEEGPKNPLKGISMKSLVLALNAQFGVGAGGKGIFCPCGFRALSNGMENPTLLLWRPALVPIPTPFAVKDWYDSGLNL